MWIAPLVALALAQVAVIATSVYLHRALAHRALRLHPVVDRCFRAVLWLTTGQSRREWVAVHRKHHTFTDREGDPHSPRLLGFWNVQLWNVYYYMREARNPRHDPDVRAGHRGGLAGSRALLAGAESASRSASRCCAWSSGSGSAWPRGSCTRSCTSSCSAPLINGLGHWRGAQNFGNTAYNSRAARLGDGRGEPAQQPSRPPARAEVQHAAVRVRSVVGRDPLPRRGRAGRDRGRARPACRASSGGRAIGGGNGKGGR